MLKIFLLCTLFLIVFTAGAVLTYAVLQNCDERLRSGKGLAISFGCNVILLSVCAMLLGIAQAFRLRYVVGLYLLLCVVFFYLGWRKSAKKAAWKELFCVKVEKPLLIIIALAAVLYLSFPTYYMWAGRDYGIYFIDGIHTAETGRITYPSDQWLNENYEYLDEVIEPGYPAFYSSYLEGTSEAPGDINPQFLPLYWCLLSVAYNLAGIEGLVRITALMALVTLSVYYFFLKHFCGKRAAVCGTLLLAICPAQIWGARITQSEQMSQLLFLLAAFLFALGWEKDKKALLYLAVSMIGIGSFCRIDNYFLGLGILCIGIYTALFCRQKRKTVFWCVIQCAVWFLAGFIYTNTVHSAYVQNHWKGSLGKLIWGNIIVFIIYLIILAVTFQKKDQISGCICRLCKDKRVRIAVPVLAGLMIAGLYFVRPLTSDNVYFDGLRQYAFYFCPLLLPFVVMGIGAFIDTGAKEDWEKRTEPLLLFLGTGSITTLFYSLRPSITMDHFFMSRRWIPVNFLFIFFVATVGFFYLFDKCKKENKMFYLKRGALLFCGIFVLCYMAEKDMILMKEPAYEGMKEDYARLNLNLPEDTLILTDKAALAGMLRYVYGKQVYLLCDEVNAQQLIRYMAEEKTVYYLGNIWDSPIFWKIKGELCYSGHIEGRAPESSMGYYPKQIQASLETANLYRLLPEECDSIELISAVNVFDESVRNEEAIEMSGQGCIFFGPYVRLPKGRYVLHIQTESDMKEDEVIGTMEIVINEEVVYEAEVAAKDEPNRISFEIKSEEDILQTRFIKTCEEDARCVSLRLEK